MSDEKVGFVSMAKTKKSGVIPTIGIGLLGGGFMGKAHSNGYLKMPYIFWPPPAKPVLIKICDKDKDKAIEEAKRYGFLEYCTDWKELVNDDRVKIFINSVPNDMHKEPCIEAAKAGKHIVCEKPLGRNASEAKEMLDAVKKAKVKNICDYSSRMFPALILAKNLISDGKLGKIYHFRAKFLQEWITDANFPLTWRLVKNVAGSGSLGDLGAHIIDLARWLCGEPSAVMAVTKTFIKERPLLEDPEKRGKVDVDDAFVSTIEFNNGAIGTIEASRFCLGRKNHQTIEINGELGSIFFNIENLNDLHVYFKEEILPNTIGFHKVSVTESFHPYYEHWWPHGHIIGWEHSFVHSAYNMVNSVVNNVELEPMVATFEDGYKNNVICDAILDSAESGKKVKIVY